MQLTQKVVSKRQLIRGIGERVEITNDFTCEEIAQVLEHDQAFCDIFKNDNDGFLLIAKTMQTVSGGKVGYLNKLNIISPNGSAAVTRILEVVKQRDDTW